MAKELTALQEDQVNAVTEDIRNAFYEDFVFINEDQVREAVAALKAKLDKIAAQADMYIHNL